MSDANQHEAELIRQKNEIETLNAKFDGLKEIISMTNKRIDFFRDTAFRNSSIRGDCRRVMAYCFNVGRMCNQDDMR